MKTLIVNIPDTNKKAGLDALCKKLGINVRVVNDGDADKTLISIISGGKYELNGFGGTNLKSGDSRKLSEFIVFQGFEEDALQDFLRKYKETGLERIPLKAIVTPYNISWTLYDLVEHLKEESKRIN